MCVSVMPLNGGNRNKGCNRSFGIVDNVPKSQIPNPKSQIPNPKSQIIAIP